MGWVFFSVGMHTLLPGEPLAFCLTGIAWSSHHALALPLVGILCRVDLTIRRLSLFSTSRRNPTDPLSLHPQVLYGCGGQGLGANIIFMLAMSVWVSVLAFVGLMGIKHFVGLRVPMVVEEMGMDKSRHVRHNKSNVALRRALRSAAGKEDKSSAGSSHRPSFKSSHPGSPRHIPARPTLSHWKD